jgi:hypothetical protein
MIDKREILDLATQTNAITTRSDGTAQASARATALLARAVQSQANVLAYIDGFMLLGFAAIGALLLMLTLRDPPAQPLSLGSTSLPHS